MTTIYQALRPLLTRDELKDLRRKQKDWIFRRDACVKPRAPKVIDCLDRAIRARTAALTQLVLASFPKAVARIAQELPSGRAGFVQRSKDGKALFFEKRELGLYENLGQELARPRNAAVMEGGAVRSVKSCAEYLSARKAGASRPSGGPCGALDAQYRDPSNTCELLATLGTARPPVATRIRMSRLPVELWRYYITDTAYPAVADSLELARPTVKRLGIQASKKFDGEIARDTLVPVAISDFNGDGAEDLLVRDEGIYARSCNGKASTEVAASYLLLTMGKPGSLLRQLPSIFNGYTVLEPADP